MYLFFRCKNYSIAVAQRHEFFNYRHIKRKCRKRKAFPAGPAVMHDLYGLFVSVYIVCKVSVFYHDAFWKPRGT